MDDLSLSVREPRLWAALTLPSPPHFHSMQEAACSNLGVLFSRRGQYSKAKEMFERNFAISRKVVNAVQAGATTGERTTVQLSSELTEHSAPLLT